MRRWDVFCAVIDNYGDIGTCWRLVQQLAGEFQADIRLWVDHLGSFAALCPGISTDSDVQRIGPIEIRHWSPDFPNVEPADVVVEAFACELPVSYVAAMARRAVTPVWINLEYLSAEAWVDDCHLLLSPHPSLPLTKYFFFPGFTSKTGGLLRERDLLTLRNAFDSEAESEFWRCVGIPPRIEGEIRISLFCYENVALPELLECWADSPDSVRVLVCPGAATEQVGHWFGEVLSTGQSLQRKSLTVHPLPFLPQPVYDRLLWACDVNFVRGEDSFVRAQWAQRPFVWQIYPQAENAHLVKLDAFLARFLGNFEDSEAIRNCWRAWNGNGDMSAAWRDFAANRLSVQQHGKVWACQLDRTADLANNLACFVRGKF